MTLNIDEIFARIVRLASRAERNFIELGRLLRKLADEDQAFFEMAYTEAGLSRRRAYYFVLIVKQFEGLAVSDAELGAIGWTRAQIIGKHVTPENLDELMALAKQHRARDLRIMLSGGGYVQGTRSVSLFFKPDQYERFAKAVLAHGGAMQDGNLKNRERALMNLIKAAEQAAS